MISWRVIQVVKINYWKVVFKSKRRLAMVFGRWVKSDGSTWAFRQFNEYETQMNNMYWSGEAALHFSMFNLRNSPMGATPQAVLKSTGINATRFPKKMSEYNRQLNDMRKWTRASFVMAAAGAFESYINRVALTALKSDPALIYGKARAIDGVNWLKIGIDVDHSKLLSSFAKGPWDQRYSEIKKVFGEINNLRDNLSELDKIRVYRNGVGHAFGRTLVDVPNLLTRDVEDISSISERRLQKWMGVMSRVAKSVDEVLRDNHIGRFEEINHFHHFLASSKQSKSRDKGFVKSYKKSVGNDIGHAYSVEYYQELIKYYDRA